MQGFGAVCHSLFPPSPTPSFTISSYLGLFLPRVPGLPLLADLLLPPAAAAYSCRCCLQHIQVQTLTQLGICSCTKQYTVRSTHSTHASHSVNILTHKLAALAVVKRHSLGPRPPWMQTSSTSSALQTWCNLCVCAAIILKQLSCLAYTTQLSAGGEGNIPPIHLAYVRRQTHVMQPMPQPGMALFNYQPQHTARSPNASVIQPNASHTTSAHTPSTCSSDTCNRGSCYWAIGPVLCPAHSTHVPGSCFCRTWMASVSPAAAAARASFASAALLVVPAAGPNLLSCRYRLIASAALPYSSNNNESTNQSNLSLGSLGRTLREENGP